MPTKKTIEVPVEWIEGLIDITEQTENSFRKSDNSIDKESFNLLLGYIDSAKILLK